MALYRKSVIPETAFSPVSSFVLHRRSGVPMRARRTRDGRVRRTRDGRIRQVRT